MKTDLICLNNLVLNDVRLIEDYLQMLFADGKILNVYNTYTYDGDSVITLVGHVILDVEENCAQLVLSFSNQHTLVIGLEDSDYNGPEALELIRKEGDRVVWN